MDKEFVPYESALALKELGFDEPCFAFYDEDKYLFTVREQDDIYEGWLIAPTYSQAFRWFRKKHLLSADITIEANKRNDIEKWMYSVVYLDKNTYSHSKETYSTYEEAELACLKKLIEIVKEDKQ